MVRVKVSMRFGCPGPSLKQLVRLWHRVSFAFIFFTVVMSSVTAILVAPITSSFDGIKASWMIALKNGTRKFSHAGNAAPLWFQIAGWPGFGTHGVAAPPGVAGGSGAPKCMT